MLISPKHDLNSRSFLCATDSYFNLYPREGVSQLRLQGLSPAACLPTSYPTVFFILISVAQYKCAKVIPGARLSPGPRCPMSSPPFYQEPLIRHLYLHSVPLKVFWKTRDGHNLQTHHASTRTSLRPGLGKDALMFFNQGIGSSISTSILKTNTMTHWMLLFGF